MQIRNAYLVRLLPIAILPLDSPFAQISQASKSAKDTGTTSIELAVRRVNAVLHRPLHPTVKSVAPGGGPGAGLAYQAPSRGLWKTSADAIVTVHQYWSAEVVTGYHGRRAEVEAFARARDMKRLDYYGPGTSSQLADRTDFRLRDPVIGTHGRVRLTPWLAIGGRVEEIWPDVSRGRSPSLPSIEQRFSESVAPGMTSQPRFGRYEASVDIHVPPGVGEALYQGTRYRMTYAIYSDQELDRFSFRRTDVEVQQQFALLAPHHRLTLHGWVSTTDTDAGNVVPFYLQRTLGGSSDVRSVHEDRIGSDGTAATLRGFRNLRFRDRNLLLLQAECRVPVWGPFDATVFADAGKVTRRRKDLDLSDMKHDFGFSLSVMKGVSTAARFDVGFGGGEGVRLFLTLGDVLK